MSTTLLNPNPPFLGFVGGDSAAQLERHIDLRTRALEQLHRRSLAALADHDAVRDYRIRVRERAEAALGGPLPDIRNTEARVVNTLQVEDVEVESVLLRDDREVVIPVSIMRPAGVAHMPLPAVLLLPGHSARTAATNMDLAATIASAGFVVALAEVWGQGERSDYRDPDGLTRLDLESGDILPVLEHNWGGAASWVTGDSVARHMVQDARSVLHHLAARPDVDACRIGVTGASGGGLLTTWLMLLEPSLAAAAPLIFITDQEHIRSSGIPQCAEQIALGDGAGWLDHVDAIIAMSPRPVLIASGDFDFFPIDGALATVAQAAEIYAILGAREALEHRRFDCGHAVPREMRRAVADFFADHLGRARPTADQEREWPVERLAATESGYVLIDDPRARGLSSLAQQRLTETPHGVSAESSRRWLTDRIRRGERLRAPHVRWTGEDTAQRGSVTVRRRTGFWPVDDGIDAAGVLLEPTSGGAKVIVALFDRGTADLPAHETWVQERLADGEAVLAVDVRGTGSLAPRPRNWFPLDGNYGTQFELLVNLFRIGDSLAAGRAYDVLRGLDVARGLAPSVRIESWGFGNFAATLAAVVDGEVVLRTHGAMFDPRDFVGSIPTGSPRDWQHIVPGIAVHAPRHQLARCLDDRWEHAEALDEEPSGMTSEAGAE